MEFIAEIVQGTGHSNQQWCIDFYRYENTLETASATEAMQQTEEVHSLRVAEYPAILRVSVCLCIIGPLQRLLIATRGLINSQCNPREFVGLLRGVGGIDDRYIGLLQHAVRTSWP
jgi:hypothetical protein